MTEKGPAHDPLAAGVHARIASERGWRAWLRALPTPVRLALGAGVLALLGVGVGAGAPRSDLDAYPAALLIGSLAALAALALLVTSDLLRPM